MHKLFPPDISTISLTPARDTMTEPAQDRMEIFQAARRVFAGLEHLTLPAADAARLGIPSADLDLRRAWPLGSGALALEYVTSEGEPIPGQTFPSQKTFARCLKKTVATIPVESHATVYPLPSGKLLLQIHGADRRLPGLAPLLAVPDAKLVVHRPERRAVVRVTRQGIVAYAKVTRPHKISTMVTKARAAQHLFRSPWRAPSVLAVDEAAGVMELSALPGRSLHELTDSARLPQAARLAGEALAALHRLPPPNSALLHDAPAEISVLARWLERIELFGPEVQAVFQRQRRRVTAALLADDSPHVLLHRDFYDKQLILSEDGRLGLLDFDTLGMGEAALDVANALVHMELRCLQGRVSPETTAAAQTALLDGYKPAQSVVRRLHAYADASRLRLACVYLFRPRGRALVPHLLGRIGAAVLFGQYQ